MGSGPNAENRVHATDRCFKVPSTVVYSSGRRPVRATTRSLGATPSDDSTFAKRFVVSSSSR